ncbi:MAG: hypothetical protein Q9191_008364 [Dirinaria sp. TL-2023a]
MSEKHSLESLIRQSPPLDTSTPINESWLKTKTILITGGASGFGAGFFKRWAAAGATVIIGDINRAKGESLTQELRTETKNQALHFIHCDVTSWASQVNLFKQATKLSPHGGIDSVIANAGIASSTKRFEDPPNLSTDEPPPPDLQVLDVNLTGAVYTTHLALWYLPRNPGSLPCDPIRDPATTSPRDRHLLLMSSAAGLMPIPGEALYGASKHALVGLYRSLRSSAFVHGVRINMLCPYFIDTPLLHAGARAVLAGGTIGQLEDVVRAGTRLVADPNVVGRAAFVGPRMRVRQDDGGEWRVVREGEEKAVWEIYVHDFEDSDLFMRKLVGLLNAAMKLRGWIGWGTDLVGAVGYGFRSWLKKG